MANRCLSFQLIHKRIFFIMNKKSNIDIDKMKLIKIIGRGMYGTVYLSKGVFSFITFILFIAKLRLIK